MGRLVAGRGGAAVRWAVRARNPTVLKLRTKVTSDKSLSTFVCRLGALQSTFSWHDFPGFNPVG